MAAKHVARHAKPRPDHSWRWRAATVFAALACLVPVTQAAQPAQASVNYGSAALNWAEDHTYYNGTHWYAWGGTGPSYDCSGLVMVAYRHAGISLPHSTYAMLASGHLHWIPLSQARRGDLLFFGSGHVEFATVHHHMSYGAHSTGERIGWEHWGWGWQPTMAFRVW